MTPETIKPIEKETLASQRPTDHLVVRSNAGELTARCSVWTDSTPLFDNEPVGVIGHFAAANADDAIRVLCDAVEYCREKGLGTVVGPMDGNTWCRYRLLTDRSSDTREEPPFFLEPDNPDEWPNYFEHAGFTPLATYFSGVSDDLTITDPRVPEVIERLNSDGVTFRNIDLLRLRAELGAVHALSVDAFADNFLYTPIDQEEFVSMYVPISPHLRRELIILAERRGELVGFMFGLPNLAQAEHGQAIDTAIAKTIAVRPGRAGAGLGSVLMAKFHDAARSLGYRRVIHALMHEGNRSRGLVAKFGSRTIRRYTLFARSTAAQP